jgi:hypothetical protein
MKNETAERLKRWLDYVNQLKSSSSDVAKKLYSDLAITPTDELRKAAKYFDLDPRKPTEAAILLRILAGVIFETREPKRPKGSKKWDERRLFRLCCHHMLVEDEIPNISDRMAGLEIKKRFPEHYRHDDPKTIQKRLPAARNEWKITWDDVVFMKKEIEEREDYEKYPEKYEIIPRIEFFSEVVEGIREDMMEENAGKPTPDEAVNDEVFKTLGKVKAARRMAEILSEKELQPLWAFLVRNIPKS